MGMIFGKIDVETLQYSTIHQENNFSIREYNELIEVCVKYDVHKDTSTPFRLLAKYIGVFGDAENIESNKIAMTAPVITREEEGTKKSSEKIAMTAPVITTNSGNIGEMSFVLPQSKYKSIEQCPKPTNESVSLRTREGFTTVCLDFNGRINEQMKEELEKKQSEIKAWFESTKYKNEYEIDESKKMELHRFNPPWTIPYFRKNEILLHLKRK